MKHYLVGGVALALLFSTACSTEESENVGVVEAAQSAGATSVFHDVANGGGASLYGGDGLSFYYVDVWQGSASSAILSYHVQAVDPTSEVCVTESYPPMPPCPPDDPACPCNMDPMSCQPPPYTYCYYTRYTIDTGWGEIPANDFHVGPNAARLSTTLPESPQFYSQHCTIDEVNWSFQCTSGGGGTIDLDWSSNRQYSSFSSGVQQFRYGRYLHTSTGQQRYASADASGSVLGVSVDGYGTINSGHNVQIDIMPAPDPGPGGGPGGGGVGGGGDPMLP